MYYCQRTWCCLLLGLACAAVVGCGGGDGVKLVTISGKVLDDGEPIVIDNFDEEYSHLYVQFYALDDAGKPVAGGSGYGTVVDNTDGSFEVSVPKGRVRAAVYRYDEVDGMQEDIWGGKYSVTESTFDFDAPSDEPIVINLSGARALRPVRQEVD